MNCDLICNVKFLVKNFLAAESAFSGTIGTHALHLCFYQKASEQLQIGCELETNFRMGESTGTIGYQIDLPKADLVFRGKDPLYLSIIIISQ